MSADRGTEVRRAQAGDLPALGRLGAQVLHAHYAFDRDRFMAPGRDPERGYARFLEGELREPDVIVLVAERDGIVVGYVYAGLEPRSWQELREAAGFIHDIVVDEGSRRHGVASALVEAAVAWLRERGAPRVMLWTAEKNEGAQRLFAKLGFRRTMVEMTREL
ncbi:MAG: GNAT family N-acetyltransferase [Vicinamibacterales bacterium]